jgi:hypothetical protein
MINYNVIMAVQEPSNLEASFPELAADVRLPPLFPPEAFFSSIMRVSSPGLTLWTHYDVMDNVLLQIRVRVVCK